MGLKQQILLAVIAQAVSTLASTETTDLLNVGQLNITNCSGTSASEDSRSLESGLSRTVCTVFNNIDEIFRHLLDFPLFYSVPKPTFKSVYKTYEDDSSENYIGFPGTSKSTGESEAFDIAYENAQSSTESEVELTPNQLNLDSISEASVALAPKVNRKRRTVDSTNQQQEGHPYMVLIRNKADKTFKQTGVAVSDYIILTAASGLTDAQGRLCDPNQLSIYTQLPNNTGSLEMPVVNIYQNPQVKSGPGEEAKDDVALLEIINPNNKSHFYPSLAKVDSKTLPMDCSVLAWNVPEKFFSHPVQEILHVRKESVILSDPDKCKQVNPNFNESNSYCSVIKDAPHGYMGDLGAPLICSGELYGFIGSAGTKTKGLDLFTRIDQYHLFIEENKQRSFKRFANQTWKSKELFDVSSGESSRRPNMNQLMTSPLITLAVVVFHYIL